MSDAFNVPILLIVFKRVETTRAVLNEIRKLKPKQLFVASDGPRDEVVGEADKVNMVRELFKEIDWDCELKTLFREKNGVHNVSISSAITWFFEQVPEGIILEDDCLPHLSFFRYCEELLQKYRDDERIMLISGANFQQGIKRGTESYYFSQISSTWGYATWRRSWKHYDIKMTSFPQFKEQNQIKNIFDDKKIQKYWLNIFGKVYDGRVLAYDYPWVYAVWANGGLSICPNVNLISNIGFGNGGLSSDDENDKFANLVTNDIGEISHPRFMIRNKEAEEFYMNQYLLTPFLKKVKNKLKAISKRYFSLFFGS